MSDLYQPLEDGSTSRCYISKSYDAATHFESAADDILNLYERISGHPYSFESIKRRDEEVNA